MAAPVTSGTANFNLDILQIAEEAFENAGTELRSGYDLRTMRRSMGLVFLEWANKGINLWTVKEASIPLVAGTATYDLAGDTIDVLEAVVRTGSGTSQTDQNLSRMSVSDYSQLTNKNSQGKPTQFYVDRQNRATVTVWPVPDLGTYTFQYWYIRRIEDAGVNTNNVDMPERFIPALIDELAYRIAKKKPGLENRVPNLKLIAEQSFELAASEDRSKAPSAFVPQYGPISVTVR